LLCVERGQDTHAFTYHQLVRVYRALEISRHKIAGSVGLPFLESVRFSRKRRIGSTTASVRRRLTSTSSPQVSGGATAVSENRRANERYVLHLLSLSTTRCFQFVAPAMTTDADFFAENARHFPNGVYHDDSEYDLISLVVVDDVSIKVFPRRATSISIM
jgi:hypothetical protein